jgi:peptidyl-tRNA hydrolase
MDVKKLRMYILVKEDVPNGIAITSAAHASIACFRKYLEVEAMKSWVEGVFHKVVCKVSESEFEMAKLVPDNVVMTESSMEGKEVAIAFCPREEFPKGFKFFKLWK